MEQNTEMDNLYITHYYYPGTDPWKNIMLLPEEEAYRVAGELAKAHPDTMSFYRFADFVNYYPSRKRADAFVRQRFMELGGKPELMHPYCFVLGESEYLCQWFSNGEKLTLSLDEIPKDQVSFTLGDSCALLGRGTEPVVLTKDMLLERIEEYNGSLDDFLKDSLVGCAYVEVQLWTGAEKKV